MSKNTALPGARQAAFQSSEDLVYFLQGQVLALQAILIRLAFQQAKDDEEYWESETRETFEAAVSCSLT